MERLQLDKSRYYRIKRGQMISEVEKVLSCPVKNNFAGAVVYAENCLVYTVRPFDNYASIAAAYNIDEEKLKAFNFGRILYPTRIVYIPESKT